MLDDVGIAYPSAVEIGAEQFELYGDLRVALADHLGEVVATRGEKPGDGDQNECKGHLTTRIATTEKFQHRLETSHDELLLPPARRRRRTQSLPAATGAILTTPIAERKVLRFHREPSIQRSESDRRFFCTIIAA